MHIFFRKPFVWDPDKLPKKSRTPYTLVAFLKTPPKHYKTWENKQNILGRSSTQPSTDFNSRSGKSSDFQFYNIYIYGHNLNQWAKERSKFQFFPNSIVKNDPEKPPHLVWGFFTFQCFVFFLILAFSCLSFSSFPLLLDILKPKSGPSNEVIGLYIYIYIYGCGAICRRKFGHFCRFFTSFIAKKGKKEMLQICPVSVHSRSIEITPNWLETAVPNPFSKKVIGTAVSGLSMGSYWV